MRGATVVAVLMAGVLTAPAAGAAEGSGTGPRDTGHAATQAAMDAQVADGVPGVLGQARDQNGVWNGQAGVGDLITHKPRSKDDRFRAGSITKTFTATVLLQLQTEGAIDLDDSVDTYLPGVVRGNGHDGRQITIRQLLNHTSGIFNYTDDPEFRKKYFTMEFFNHRYDSLTPQELIAVAMRHQPLFPPGTDWGYSNTNYVLAGLIIEKVTGQPYATEVRQRIVEPLRLRATSFPGTHPHLPRPHGRAYSKFPDDPKGAVHDVTSLNMSALWAAGEVISNPTDLNRFYTALLHGDLLPLAALSEMRTTVATSYPEMRYGLGLAQMQLSCQPVWGHEGSVPGSASYAFTSSDAQHSMALNLNGDWSGDGYAVLEAEFCGDGSRALGASHPRRPAFAPYGGEPAQ